MDDPAAPGAVRAIIHSSNCRETDRDVHFLAKTAGQVRDDIVWWYEAIRRPLLPADTDRNAANGNITT